MREEYNLVSISISGHEGGVCMLRNGELYEHLLEERISGKKYDDFLFYVYEKIKKFHELYGIDEFLFVNGSDADINESQLAIEKHDMDDIQREFCLTEHHLFHAASGFYASGFDEAICLVIDGWGADYRIDKVLEMANIELSEEEKKDAENYQDTAFLESTSIYSASYPCEFNLLHKYLIIPSPQPKGFIEGTFPNDFFQMLSENDKINANSAYDIGIMYGTITHHLGWSRDECGKTMGLAAYGKENPNLPPYILDHNDMLCGNMNLFYSNRLINTTNYPEMNHNGDFQKKSDIAYKIQKTMENVLVKRISQILTKMPETKNIVFSGGCALNICANSIIQEKFPQINFFIDPIAGDACQAYGSAKLQHHARTKSMKKDPLKTMYHGLHQEPLSIIKKQIELEVIKQNQTKS